MIQLFNVSKCVVDTSKFTNLLHDPVKDFVEHRVAEYVGAKYCVAVASCTDGLFLALKSIGVGTTVQVPSLITTRFLNAIIHAGCKYKFTDDVYWVGNAYDLIPGRLTDSAQQFDPQQYNMNATNDDHIMVFSNYPTKPLGGLKGGLVVGNNKDVMDWIRQAAYFGEQFSVDSWMGKSSFVGWQMYMNSVEAYMVNNAMNNYEWKRDMLDRIRNQYMGHFGEECVTADSYHLFRIWVGDNQEFMSFMKKKHIATGIHYPAAHLDPVYGDEHAVCTLSEIHAKGVASIPFHDGLIPGDMRVIDAVKEYYGTL